MIRDNELRDYVRLLITNSTDQLCDSILEALSEKYEITPKKGQFQIPGIPIPNKLSEESMVSKIPEERRELIMITSLLKNIGCDPSLVGFQMLAKSIQMCRHDDTYIHNITKKLYPTVAEKFGTTSNRAERAMRHVIYQMWSCRDYHQIAAIFGESMSKKETCPTYSQFVASTVDYLSTYNY